MRRIFSAAFRLHALGPRVTAEAFVAAATLMEPNRRLGLLHMLADGSCRLCGGVVARVFAHWCGGRQNPPQLVPAPPDLDQ